jgi:hypothetical protein
MPCVSEWRRAYEVNRSSWIPKVVFLVVLFLVFSGTVPFSLPFVFGVNDRWWLVLLNPWFDLLVLLTLLSGWAGARSGVYVGDAGIMVRKGFTRVVVPWHEIAYAGLAQVPNYRVTRRHEPHLGLTLVAPSGDTHPLPVRLRFAGWNRPRGGSPDFLDLTDQPMAQLINDINEMAARHRTQPQPPHSSWPTPPR